MRVHFLVHNLAVLGVGPVVLREPFSTGDGIWDSLGGKPVLLNHLTKHPDENYFFLFFWGGGIVLVVLRDYFLFRALIVFGETLGCSRSNPEVLHATHVLVQQFKLTVWGHVGRFHAFSFFASCARMIDYTGNLLLESYLLSYIISYWRESLALSPLLMGMQK